MTITSERPETVLAREVRHAREQFVANTVDHKMTVCLDTLDQGTPYRHLRFAQPGTGLWSFNLITWPGHLAISGDLQDHIFCRLHDMFDFFRRSNGVNVTYWAEKLVAEGRNTNLGRTRYSDERFVERVTNYVDDWIVDLCGACIGSLRAAVKTELFDELPMYLEQAHELLAEFRWAPVHPGCRGDFEFVDTWDWDLAGYDHHFLVALHAVRYGVNTYLAANPDRYIAEGAHP